MARLLLCLLFVGASLPAIVLIATADDAEKEAIQKDRKRIEGRWRFVELVVNGNEMKEEDVKNLVVINDVDGAWRLLSQGKEISEGTSTIDPMKEPKTIDFSPTKGEAKGSQFQGIYRLGEKTRKVVFAPADEGRPTGFSSPPGSGHVLVKFERISDE